MRIVYDVDRAIIDKWLRMSPTQRDEAEDKAGLAIYRARERAELRAAGHSEAEIRDYERRFPSIPFGDDAVPIVIEHGRVRNPLPGPWEKIAAENRERAQFWKQHAKVE